jgi:hypothetical protein
MDEMVQQARIDRMAIKVFHSFAEAEADERAYWHSLTPLERLQHMELLRRINYGERATAGFQRVFAVAQRA